MKHRVICGMLLLAFPILLQAQSEIRYYDYNWKPCAPAAARFVSEIIRTDSGFLHRDYFVHEKSLQMTGLYADAEGKTRNGQFYYFHANQNLESTGAYRGGKKQGPWLSYHSNGMMQDSSHYDNGRIVGISMSWWPNGIPSDSLHVNEDGTSVRVSWHEDGAPSAAGRYDVNQERTGKWQFFHPNGSPSSIEVYVNGKLTEQQLFDEKGIPEKPGSIRDRDAEFPGGMAAWQKYLYKKIYFPDGFKFTNTDQAIVVVSFSIDPEGNVGDVFVSTPFYPQFDRIAKKAIEDAPKWKPAISHNRKVKVWRRQPVTFQQPEE